jgi:hypothetical protein
VSVHIIDGLFLFGNQDAIVDEGADHSSEPIFSNTTWN